ncbi:MAG TPA: aminotransferase class I/II-fold pyridoxal phosphate-dependent enzyme [Gaiellales bacterium]|nr:aminotransferase class I/II-fold pyridoxal phosphate-dependent enzyme [Gaiellales bacterium]
MTDWERLARPALRGLARYDPGPSRDELQAQHGLAELEPLNWNEDLFGAPQEALDAAADELGRASLYPERAFADFRDAVAGWLGLPAASVVPGHGAQALIASAAAAFVDRGTPVVAPRLTYGLYAQVSAARGAEVTRVEPDGLAIDLERMADEAQARRARVVWICDPNNPTGALIDPGRWSRFLDRLPADCLVIADEAYIDFAEPELRADRVRDVLAGRPVIVIRSFSKIFGLAGLRIGYAVCDPAVARLFDIVQEPFNVNRVGLAAGRAAVGVPGFVERRRAEVAAARAVLASELAGAGFAGHRSHTNFLLAELGVDDRAVCEELLRRGLLVRGGHEFGLPGRLRVTVGPEPLMRRAAAQIAWAAGTVG